MQPTYIYTMLMFCWVIQVQTVPASTASTLSTNHARGRHSNALLLILKTLPQNLRQLNFISNQTHSKMPTRARITADSDIPALLSIDIHFPRSDGLHGTRPKGQRTWVLLADDDSKSVAFRKRLALSLAAELSYTQTSESNILSSLSVYRAFLLPYQQETFATNLRLFQKGTNYTYTSDLSEHGHVGTIVSAVSLHQSSKLHNNSETIMCTRRSKGVLVFTRLYAACKVAAYTC
jgi:hypothetical protein